MSVNSKIIYDLKDSYKELIYYLYIRDYGTLFIGNHLGQTDRNIRSVRSTILGQITKKVIAVLFERQEFDIPLWTTEQDMVLAATNIGTLAMKEEPEESLQISIMDFVCNYGLLGLMTALPTTPEFITYEAVYLPKNHFIKDESLSTHKCVPKST